MRRMLAGAVLIGTLALTGESSVGSGARRVEAAVGLEGFRYLARERDLVRQLADLLKTPQDGVAERVSGMLSRLREAEKEIADLRGQQTLAVAGDLAAAAKEVAGVAVVTGAGSGIGRGHGAAEQERTRFLAQVVDQRLGSGHQ